MCPLNDQEECCPDCLTPNPGYRKREEGMIVSTNAVIQGNNPPRELKDILKGLFDQGWIFIDTNTLGVDLDCCEIIENMDQLEEVIKNEA
jgi:hypothetical protein